MNFNKTFSLKKTFVLGFFCVLQALLFGQRIFAAEIFGAKLSDALSDRLKKASYNPVKKPLSSAWFADFPYNIELDFPSKDESDWTIVLALAQEDAWSKEKTVKNILETFRDSYIPCNVKLVFTACDKSKIAGNEKMTGTEIFCKSVEGAQNVAALVLDLDGTKGNYVIPGAAGNLSPYYLARHLCDCLDRNECRYDISGGIFLSLYRLNAFRKNERLYSFLSKGIPAVMLRLHSNEGECVLAVNSIRDFFSTIEAQKAFEWSRHYIPFKFFSKTYWLEEMTIVFHVLGFMAIALFILSDFAFLFRRRSKRLADLKLKALLSNYLIFVTVGILSLTFLLGQKAAQVFQTFGVRNVMVLFLIKLIPAFLIITIIYPLELSRHKKISSYLYEYILSVSAVLNIFIFTFIDISFFYLFAIEYLILFFSRAFKSSGFLFLFLFLFILPFLPMINSILIYSDGRRIFNLVFCGFKENLLLGFVLVPFNFIWLRILARRNAKAKDFKTLLLSYLATSLIAIGFLTLFSFISIRVFEKIFFSKVEFTRRQLTPKDADENRLSTVTVFDSEYYGGVIRRIEITFSQDAERCEVFVTGGDENPVYFSIYETETVGHITQFSLPDKPPRSLTVQYTPNSSDSEIVVMNYFVQKNPDESQMQKEICVRENFSFISSGGKIYERGKEK
ncbi:MAG: hypothetical protein K6A42_12060 [Treponema sp.]|nr:hypothetical protein [Treponema sp.]